MNVMILSEMKEKPKRAGLAELQFGYKGKRHHLPCHPRRIGKKIILPDYPNALFLPLKKGKQFLYQFNYQTVDQLWFGGTDESVFLVRLRQSEIALDEGGIFIEDSLEVDENAFYEALKPEAIKRIETTLKSPLKRQGDIWAAPLGFSIEGFCNIKPLFWPSEALVRTAKHYLLFGTRHKLTGKYICDHGIVDEEGDELSNTNEFMVAQGVVKSPNHSPMKLDQPHALMQTAHLFNPKKAD